MRQRSLHVVIATAGIAGIAALFLPFTFSISPMDAIVDRAFWQAALPFFLTIPILVASIRLTMTNSIPALESAIAYVLAGTVAGITVFWLTVNVADDPYVFSTPSDWLLLAPPLVVPSLGIAMLIRDLRKRRLQAYRPVLALQAAYLGNAILCFIGYASDLGWQAGAYLSLVTAIAYLIQTGLAYSPPQRSPATG